MFKIGEFARIADVSIHLLRHYDDIDLFKPAQIDPQSGYRYYHADQLPMLHRIVALRELGMTLEQIATMLNDAITDCEIQGMLRLKQQQVEQLIEAEHARLRRIATRLKQLQQTTFDHAYDVVIKSTPSLDVCTTGRLLISDETAVHVLIEAEHMLKRQQQLSETYSISIVYDATTTEGLHHIEIGYPIKSCDLMPIEVSTGYCLTARLLPEIAHVASVIHHGARIATCGIYQQIFQWMAENQFGHHPEHYPRELYYQAGSDPTDLDDIIEIQVPIVKLN